METPTPEANPPPLPESPAPRHTRRRLWRLLWCVGALLTLATLAYLWENWRGAQAWAAYVAEAHARGERLEVADVVPRPIPEEQNLAAAPFFRPLFDMTVVESQEEGKTVREFRWNDPAGKQALEAITLPRHGHGSASGNWRQGQFADLAQWQSTLAAQPNFPHPPVQPTAGANVLLELGKFEQPLAELHAAAAARPRALFPLRYEESFALQMPHVKVLLTTAQVVRLRAQAELAEAQNDAAFADTQLAFRLAESTSLEPLLLSFLVRVALLELAQSTFWEGQVRHRWTEEHLADFERQLAQVNLVTHFQTAMRGERNLLLFPLLRKNSANVELWANVGMSSSPSVTQLFRFSPQGWYDQNRASAGRVLGQILECLDPAQKQVNPVRAATVNDWTAHGWRFHPHTVLVRLALPAITDSLERCASAQGTVNLARVAIALERHLVRHGSYPATLEAVEPALRPTGGEWPRDPATGTLPHFQLAASHFTLYYDGWNHTDDGGVVVWKEGKKQPDFMKGDWVWPQVSTPE